MLSPTPSLTTETRTFVGETGTGIFDGYAGFRLGQAYELHYERLGDGRVAVAVRHDHCAPGVGPLMVSEAQFAKWWVR